MEEVEKARKEKDERETLRKMQEMRRELGLKLKNNKSPKEKNRPRPSGGVNLNTLKPGADVIICDIGDRGSILSINKKDNTAVVQVGIMKITAHADNLAAAPEETSAKKRRSPSASTAGMGGGLRREAAKSEIDLRGMSLEEAEAAADKFLDEAVMSGLTTVSIIHGKGTGTLRSGIQIMLRRHPHVKSYRLGKYGEGEDGVTIAELK